MDGWMDGACWWCALLPFTIPINFHCPPSTFISLVRQPNGQLTKRWLKLENTIFFFYWGVLRHLPKLFVTDQHFSLFDQSLIWSFDLSAKWHVTMQISRVHIFMPTNVCSLHSQLPSAVSMSTLLGTRKKYGQKIG
jgi:hypothetical protein